jgi:GNAT superfamily N-acetyltransferase
MSEQNQGELIFIDPVSGLEIRAISPSERPAIEDLVREGFPETHVAARLDALATIPDPQVFAAFQDGKLVAAYALRRDGMANDLALVVVREDHRRQGIGRSLLQDALRRSGRRPLATQTPEAILPFFKACGFKLVGKRVQPDGEIWFRVGWHAPGANFKGGTTGALTNPGVKPET